MKLSKVQIDYKNKLTKLLAVLVEFQPQKYKKKTSQILQSAETDFSVEISNKCFKILLQMVAKHLVQI